MTLPDAVLDGAVETLPLEFAILDATGTIVYTNQTWREFACDNDYVGDPSSVGVNYLDVCESAAEAGDEDAREIATLLRGLLDGDRTVVTFEYPCHSPDQRRWFLLYATRYAVDDDRYVQVSHLDVTERKESELAVERRNERLQAVASVLSHDLRNPITVAQGYLQSLSDRIDAEEIRYVGSALDRMNSIVTDALVLARGTDVGEMEAVSLRAAAERAWEHVETREATLAVTESIRFEANRSLLGNLFENLFRNAVTHGGDDVAVRVGPLADGRGFYVEDDGPGVPADLRASVFESGFTTRSDEGTGLGLSIVAEIVEGHGWDIDLADAGAGGARFEVRGVTRLDG